MRQHIYTYIHTQIYIHTHIYIHAHTYRYTHAHYVKLYKRTKNLDSRDFSANVV